MRSFYLHRKALRTSLDPLLDFIILLGSGLSGADPGLEKKTGVQICRQNMASAGVPASSHFSVF
jgi:hypothetical protein